MTTIVPPAGLASHPSRLWMKIAILALFLSIVGSCRAFASHLFPRAGTTTTNAPARSAGSGCFRASRPDLFRPNGSAPTLRSTYPFRMSLEEISDRKDSDTFDQSDTSETTIQPRSHYDAVVSGGGPAGLLTAIMLAQKYGPGYKVALCERRPGTPPSPSDDTVWNDVAKFYLLGIGHRGQRALREFGIFDDFVKASVPVKGRRDWQPGKTKVEDGKITLAQKEVESRILARDKLVGVLHHHIVNNYKNSGIDLLYGYEVDPINFGTANEEGDGSEGTVTVRISKCEETGAGAESYVASQDSEQTCDVESSVLATASLLIGADGSARTVANAMEDIDNRRHSDLNPFQRLFAPKPFKVTRFEDDNPRVYKSVPILLPSDWPRELNYSARSRGSRITLEALPSDDKGNLCALLLMKPDDELAQPHVEPAKLRAFFDEEFPQFGALVDDDEMEHVATKPSSALPSFRYAGPRLNVGERTIVLGDAAHTVKPYYGLGANTALEDVRVLSEVLDEVSEASPEEDVVPRAVKVFSDKRAADSSALVTISRNMDRPGKLFFVCFLLPLILDGVFHKLAPQIFAPNNFAMFQRRDLGFKQIQRKKRLDRCLQIGLLGLGTVGLGLGLNGLLAIIANAVGKSRGFVGGVGMAVAIAAVLAKKAMMGKDLKAATA